MHFYQLDRELVVEAILAQPSLLKGSLVELVCGVWLRKFPKTSCKKCLGELIVETILAHPAPKPTRGPYPTRGVSGVGWGGWMVGGRSRHFLTFCRQFPRQFPAFSWQFRPAIRHRRRQFPRQFPRQFCIVAGSYGRQFRSSPGRKFDRISFETILTIL